MIATKKVVVISKTYCPYSRQAKQILAHYTIDAKDIKVWDIESDENCVEIQQYMKKLTGSSTVPRVFINGKFVGGGEDIERLHRSGELANLLHSKTRRR